MTLRVEIYSLDLDPLVDFYTRVLGFTLDRVEHSGSRTSRRADPCPLATHMMRQAVDSAPKFAARSLLQDVPPKRASSAHRV